MDNKRPTTGGVMEFVHLLSSSIEYTIIARHNMVQLM